jgi:hypothetical protein
MDQLELFPNNITTNKVVNTFELQIENLDKSIVDYFNDKFPIYIKDQENNKKNIKILYNVGETWNQVKEIQNKQVRGEFNLQKPIITIHSSGIEAIKEWNRLPQLKILIDKQIYVNPNTRETDAIPNKVIGKPNSIPVYEWTYIKPPTFYRRFYKLNVWSDYIEDQNSIVQSIIINLISANMIIINNENYQTVGYIREMRDESNYGNRNDNTRIIKNYINFEFEGYLMDSSSIVKRRNFSTFKVTETITK